MNTLVIQRPRYGDLIVIFLTLLLMGIVAWAFFLKEDPIPLVGPALPILLLIVGIGSVVLYFSIRMMLTRPLIISIDENGFEYNPGGVSSGIVRWSNVAEIKEVEVFTTRGDLPGPVYEWTIAIKLKDPTEYTKQFNGLIRELMKINHSMYQADLFLRRSDFGKRLEEVQALMFRNWEVSKRKG